VTRLWFDSFVDSIGHVNPELRWAYDQRGRLIADTSYTDTLARGTSYAYDAVERLTSVTDPLGTWTMRYEKKRGFLDTLITPFSDTLRYTFDSQERTLGPYWQSSGPLQSRVPTFSQVGALKTLTHSVATSPSYTAGKWDRVWNPDSSGPPLLPQWTEQHGSGAATETIRDSANFDGWGRLVAWIQRKDGSGFVVRDTFRFDRVGNIKTTAGAEVYDVTTGRLTSRTDAGGTWSYSYDRAGNLVQATQAGITWTYGYDVLNRLRTVKRGATLIARYAYDVAGRRIVKRVYSNTTGGTVAYTRFVYSGSNVAFEADSLNTIGLKYVWGGAADDLLAVRDAAGNHFYVVQDLLHNVRGVVKRDGTWKLSQRFGPYGGRTAVDSSASGLGFELRYRWTGREYDSESGWYYFRARYFDATQRRFVQEDPIGYGGGVNVYAYGDGNPTNGRDPTGLRFPRSIPQLATETADLEWSHGSSGSDGWGSWTSFGDAVNIYNDLVWGYDAYRHTAEEFLRTHPESNIRIIEQKEYTVLAEAVSSYLARANKPGWEAVRQSVFNYLERGTTFVAVSNQITLYGYAVDFHEACSRCSWSAGQTFILLRDMSYITVLRADFFSRVSAGLMANTMVHEWYHGSEDYLGTQGEGTPGHCAVYYYAFYWTNQPNPPPPSWHC